MKHTSADLNVDQFPIRELSERTGVNSVTLRAWERRYGLLKPFRTDKGHRLYTAFDVEQVQRILYWINQGVAVSKVRELLSQQVSPVAPVQDESPWLAWRTGFVQTVRAFAISKWEAQLLEAIKQYPVNVVLRQGLLPALQVLQSDQASAPAYAVLRTSLNELLVSLKQKRKRVPAKDYQVLVVALDGHYLPARLITWALAQEQEHTLCLEEIRSKEEVLGVVTELGIKHLVLVGEALSQAEARRWLAQAWPVQVDWVGSGLWLEAQQENSPEQRFYANYFVYLDSLM
ncbi:MerR family transcriptional regulator [Marinomonas ostreistagni]|uniref:MerR family transcriptional regulator n=1 Tax=Marinomonas ostreistagni TaxID=359209 RepID=UPI001950E492|nr:MerR family transcriptional regulator [Marinomonas ostreistagni]MBM6551316.1 MerR family transcriptional regulator [Marinomonas ostreistagni]